MVSIVRQQARAAWPLTRGSGFNMAEGHRGQQTDLTVTVSPRSDQLRESDSARGPTGGETPPGDGQDAQADQRSSDETDCENTLTVEEEMMIQQKRERNRLAAARCRDRRRQRAAVLVQESDDLEDENGDLMKEIVQLQKEKRNFEEILRKHLPNCGVQSGESSQQQQQQHQQQIPHRLHGKHLRLEQQHPQHEHLQPRQYQRQHQHPLLLNQQHRQQAPRQQHPQRPRQQHPQRPMQQAHHPPQHKPDFHRVHRPQQDQQQYQQHQLQHQQYDQQATATNQLISQQPVCLAKRSFSATNNCKTMSNNTSV